MRKKTTKTATPIYTFALVWLICSILIDLYTMTGLIIAFVLSGISSIIVAKCINKFLKLEYEEEEVPEPRPKYSPEVEAIINDGNMAIAEMIRLRKSIKNPAVCDKIDELIHISDKIVQDAIADPSDVPQIRKFLDYYLPTTIKLLNAYDRMSSQGIEGDNLSKSITNIEEMLDTAIVAYKKQLDSLFANQALDIETDIKVMNAMLNREGLVANSLDEFILNSRKNN